MNLDIGDIVKHPELGLGTVIQIEIRVIFYQEKYEGVDRKFQLSELTKPDN